MIVVSSGTLKHKSSEVTLDRRIFLKLSSLAAVNAALPATTSSGSLFASVRQVRRGVFDDSVYAKRLARAQSLMRQHQMDGLFATPSTNLQYLTGINTFRSERLIAAFIPSRGETEIVCPYFEEERIRRGSVVQKILTWREEENPYALLGKILADWRMQRPRIGIEPTTAYDNVVRLRKTVPGAVVMDGGPVFDQLRLIKSEAELQAIREAISATLGAIMATHSALKEGMSEREVAGVLSSEMDKLGSPGGGLVQFGPSSALPHGGPGNSKLAHGTVVLIDAGSRIRGYTSDITRTIFWGAEPPAEYKKVFNTVRAAQEAGMLAAQPGVECQAVDHAARKVIEKAGYGHYFTHRLGHGLGMDGHEYPYLVKGNTFKLQAGNVVTIEPGIYIPGKFGVRIEDDFVITEKGAIPLSPLSKNLD